MAFILEKTSSAIIASLFATKIVGMIVMLIEPKFNIDIGKYWLDNIASNFEKKPTFNNLLVSVLYYVIYTGVFLFVGIQLTKNKEI